MARNNLLLAPDNTRLDAPYARATSPQGTLIVYPGIGGTTRMFSVPYNELEELGISLLEFHPPAHGRSTGQMTMAHALNYFEWTLKHFEISGPIFSLGHSAGANALMQYQTRFGKLLPRMSFFVQPVFDFTESAKYMYCHGYRGDLLAAISRWVTDSAALAEYLATADWLDHDYWTANQLRQKIDAISRGILLGEFLEDFYLQDNNVARILPTVGNAKVYVSRNDHWYDPERICSLADHAGVPYSILPEAQDHYFRGGWTGVWTDVKASIAQSLNL